MTPSRRGRPSTLVSALVVPALLIPILTGCGGSSTPPPAPPPASSTPAGLQILVTNDDGVSAQGIDVLVNRLRTLPGVAVSVVAPAENQSGTGSRTTSGQLARDPATTSTGYPATAVRGFPADTVRVALDDLHLRPALVVSGINQGQNVGPLVAISGTVGAARAAATRGIPAIAVSQGLPDEGGSYDFAAGADVAVREVQQLLPQIRSGHPDASTVLNVNVPTCSRGKVRGVRELPPETGGASKALDPSDCTSTATPNDEIGAFLNGFAVVTRVPAQA